MPAYSWLMGWEKRLRPPRTGQGWLGGAWLGVQGSSLLVFPVALMLSCPRSLFQPRGLSFLKLRAHCGPALET